MVIICFANFSRIFLGPSRTVLVLLCRGEQMLYVFHEVVSITLPFLELALFCRYESKAKCLIYC